VRDLRHQQKSPALKSAHRAGAHLGAGTANLNFMMTRNQRIEFEILDCTLKKAARMGGWPTTLEVFLLRVRELFPDVIPQELIAGFKRLAIEGALTLCKNEPGPIHRDYRGGDDDDIFFRDHWSELRLQKTGLSRVYFAQLTELIEPEDAAGSFLG
jgi:hypothetical protein